MDARGIPGLVLDEAADVLGELDESDVRAAAGVPRALVRPRARRWRFR
jgi:hypothetical protein